MSTSATTLQDVASVDYLMNVAATEAAPLFEYLEFEFLLEYDVFAPERSGQALPVWFRFELFREWIDHALDKSLCGSRRHNHWRRNP